MSVDMATDLIPATGKDYKGRKAAGYRLVVECDGLERKSSGGIEVFSNQEYERHVKGINTGCVVSVGDDAYSGEHLKSQWVKKGDRVRFMQYGGDMYRDGDKYYRIINDEDIYEVFE